MTRRYERQEAMSQPVSPAQEIVALCDKVLALGREPRGPRGAPAVGSYENMSGPNGAVGGGGGCSDDDWNTLAAEFDRIAQRAAILVKALDPDYNTSRFFTPQPVCVLEAYPDMGALSIGEREGLRDHLLRMGHTPEEAATLLANTDALPRGHALRAFTKMQWPGRVIDAGGHRIFLDDSRLVREFDIRFGALREWAKSRATKVPSLTTEAGKGVFPWWRAGFVLFVLESLAVLLALYWGSGDNWFQRIGNSLWLLTAVLVAVGLVFPVLIYGKAGWSQVVKRLFQWKD